VGAQDFITELILLAPISYTEGGDQFL